MTGRSTGPLARLNVQGQIVRQLGGKHQRRALGLQHQFRLLHAACFQGIAGMQRRSFRGPHRRQRHHHHRFGIAERRRQIQAQVQRVLGGQRQGGDVLEMRRVQRGQDLGRIHDRPHVRAELPRAPDGGIAELVHQVAGGPAGQLRHQRLGIGIVQNQPFGVLREAGRLLVGGLVEALLIDLDAQRPRRRLRPLLQGFGIGLRGGPDFIQVSVQPHAVPAGRLQVLPGANKRSRPVVDSLAQGAEVAARFRHQENQSLLRLLGHGNEHALVPGLAGPGFHPREPVRGRGIGGAAQERHHQDVARRLAFGEIGMDPETIAGEQIGGLADGEGDFPPLYVYIDLGSRQIERRAFGPNCRHSQKQKAKQRQTTAHASIVRTPICESRNGAEQTRNTLKYPTER